MGVGWVSGGKAEGEVVEKRGGGIGGSWETIDWWYRAMFPLRVWTH